MSRLMDVDLPSSDEEDDDYRPDKDKTAEADDRKAFVEAQQKQQQRQKRARSAKKPGGDGADATADDDGDQEEEDEEEEDDDRGFAALAPDDPAALHHDPRQRAKKAKIEHLWQLLNSKPGSKAQPPPAGEPGVPPPPSSDAAGPPDAAPPAAFQAAPAPTIAEMQKRQDSGQQHAASRAQCSVLQLKQLHASVGPSAAVSLAALCRTEVGGGKARDAKGSDLLWMRSLGLAPPSANGSKAAAAARATNGAAQAHQHANGGGDKAAEAAAGTSATAAAGDGATAPQQQQQEQHKPAAPPVSDALRAAAAAALAATREGAAGVGAVRAANKVAVTETRRFAGKEVQVTMQVDKNSKEAKKAAAAASRPAQPAPKSGLDAFLQEVAKKKKVNVLDKTKADWQQLKAKDAALEEELEAHKRSGDQYLDKVDFLKRADLREYEAERDKRLAADVRTRGRL